MVAAAPFGDVVKQRGEVGEFLARQGLHDLAEHREFVVEFRHREAPQIAHHEQCVRIDRVGVEEVVLHPAHDASERGDVAAQDAV